MYTNFQTKYFLEQIKLKRPIRDGSIYKAIAGARVDLNPHQIDAALFAMKSPFSQGVILADEVGLGKTIEAGICIAQKWAEQKRRILLIVPAALRSQWSEELDSKFFIESLILESKNFNELLRKGSINPFIQDKLIICSYNFAAQKEHEVSLVNWDLVIIDEAHRLRNVYRTSNKISNNLKRALYSKRKILLTATPLQNNLMELYGLVSFIDDKVFSDHKTFREKYVNANDESLRNVFLKQRISPFFNRTLRKQVVEYIPFTNRVAILQEYYPTIEEEVLYNKISDYLRSDRLFALPAGQRSLMTLIMRKLLASSTFAITGTIEALINKLEGKISDIEFEKELGDFDALEELKDELEEENFDDVSANNENIKELMALELVKLKEFHEFSKSIKVNAKGNNLLIALEKGFEQSQRLGGSRKAVIFTESRRTQLYLLDLLSENGYKDKIVFLNGSNNDEKSLNVYQQWLENHRNDGLITGSKQSDIKASIVEYFRENASILIGTEAAAEGINLQFCSLVVNYDLPWNPQRIEQRIGRCHRYGQKNDVVVVNFLNIGNEVDKRVYELLDIKFKLFSGLFGSSDEILGAIDSGLDFEKRIVDIYQKCKTQEEIKEAFDSLQSEFKESIETNLNRARNSLFENFDEDVARRLKASSERAEYEIGQYESWMYHFVISLNSNKIKPLDGFRFTYIDSSEIGGNYSVNWKQSELNLEKFFRYECELFKHFENSIDLTEVMEGCIQFDYTNSGRNITFLKNSIGKIGVFQLRKIVIEGTQVEEYLVSNAIFNDGTNIEEEIINKMMELPSKEIISSVIQKNDLISEISVKDEKLLLDKIESENRMYFLEECAKLDAWSDERKESLQRDIIEFDKSINELSKTLNINAEQYSLEELLKEKTEITNLKRLREKKRKDYFEEQDKIDEENNNLQQEMLNRIQSKKTSQIILNLHFKVI